ncbi:MAG: NADPH:quinone oxidoreductase family protein [Acidimicrobiales bacterium]
MRAAVCHAYGPPEGVGIEDIPVPTAGRGEAVVRVHAAALNYPDVLVVANAYQVAIPVPFTPGSEFAGVVSGVGEGVEGLAVGDRVFGTVMCGAFAEYAVAPASSLTLMPAGLDFRTAAAFQVVYLTAYHALRSVAAVRPGEWVAVLGAAGGIGSAAVDVAHVLGGRVVAVASSSDKLDLCRARGAEHAIGYDEIRPALRELTGGGASVVIDPVGGPSSEQALRSMAWGGRFVTVGYASGEIPRIPLNLVLLKGVIVKGIEIRTFREHAPDDERRDRAELLALLAEDRLRPHIGAIFPLPEVANALRHVADRRALGKVIIDTTA